MSSQGATDTEELRRLREAIAIAKTALRVYAPTVGKNTAREALREIDRTLAGTKPRKR